jgi:hypothetical protein
LRVKCAVAVIPAIPPRNGGVVGVAEQQRDHPQHIGGVPRRGAENAEGMTEEEAEAGMAHMSKVYDETGRELYMGAGDREHD